MITNKNIIKISSNTLKSFLTNQQLTLIRHEKFSSDDIETWNLKQFMHEQTMVCLKIELSFEIHLSKIKCSSSSLVVSSSFLTLLFRNHYGSKLLLSINQTALSRKQKHTLIVVFLIFFSKIYKVKIILIKFYNKRLNTSNVCVLEFHKN